MDKEQKKLEKAKNILRSSNNILEDLGKKKKGESYVAACSVGGDFFMDYQVRTFSNRDLSISDYLRSFDDGSGSYELYIYSKHQGTNPLSKIKYLLGFGKKILVFRTERNKIKAFSRGPWQKKLKDLDSRVRAYFLSNNIVKHTRQCAFEISKP